MTRKDTRTNEREHAFLSVMTAMIFAVTAFTFFMAVTDAGDDTALGANTDLSIAETDAVEDIRAMIQGALDIAVYGDTVTVAGSKTNVAGEGLTLNIGTGVTVIWKATYAGAFNNNGVPQGLITIAGGGTFEAAHGSIIDNDAPQSRTVYVVKGNLTVSGGTVSASGTGNYDSVHVAEGSVTVSGGTVISSGDYGYAVSAAAADVTITGGMVTAPGSSGQGMHIGTGNVTITGGTITSSGSNGYGVYVYGTGNLTITGGTVTSSGSAGQGIYVAKGDITVSGGEVTATGTGVHANAGDVIITDGEVTAHGSNGRGIYVAKGDITMTGGSVTSPGNYGTGIYVSTGNVTIMGGVVTSSGDHGHSVQTNSGDVTITGGTVTSSGGSSYGIFVYAGNVTITGGTVTAAATGIYLDSTGNVTITGGEVTSAGGEAIFIFNTGSVAISGGSVAAYGAGMAGIYANAGVVAITGGIVTATGAGGDAIAINTCVLAYLDGTVSGTLRMYSYASVIVKADTIYVTALYDGTNTDVTVIDGMLFDISEISWSLSGTVPLMVFDNGLDHYEIVWATCGVAVIDPDVSQGFTFAGAAEGYSTVIPVVFTIQNTGTVSMTNLTMSVTGTDAGAFVYDDTYVYSNLYGSTAGVPGQTTVLTIAPVAGLTAGIYTATVMFTDDNFAAPYTFGISFTVNASVSIYSIQGMVPPAAGEIPVTVIDETSQYTGTVTWSPADAVFEHGTVYTATITLTAKAGYSFAGVPADLFTVAGASSVTNAPGSGVINAVFPVTDGAEPRTSAPGGGDSSGSNNILLIIAVVVIAAAVAVLVYIFVIRRKK